MGMPHLQLDIAFGSAWNEAAPNWSTLTAFLRAAEPLAISRGTDSRLSAPRPGTLSFVLGNTDRRFDPDWTGGPYYGQINPLTPVRVVARVDEDPGQYVSVSAVGDIYSDYATSILGDLQVEWWGRLSDVTPAADSDLVTQGTSTAYNHRLTVDTTGALVLRVQDATPTTYTYTSTVTLGAVGILTTTDLRVKATLDLTDTVTSVCQFFWSTDNGTTWTQLGTDRTAGIIAALRSVAGTFRVGSSSDGGALTGYCYEALWMDGIDGTVVANPKFADYDQWAWGATTAGDEQDNTWTVVPGLTSVSGAAGMFRGFISEWSCRTSGLDATVAVSCVDGLSLLQLLTVSGTTGSYEDEVDADAPLGWWKLDETSGTSAADSGAAGIAGTYTNTPTLGATGPLSGITAVSFDDASTEDMTVGALTGSNVATKWSVEAWVKPDPADTSLSQSIVSFGNSSGDDKLGIGFNGAATPAVAVAHDATSTGTTASSTTHAITLPSAAAASTVIVTAVSAEGAAMTWPAGWTVLYGFANLYTQYKTKKNSQSPPAGVGWYFVRAYNDDPPVYNEALGHYNYYFQWARDIRHGSTHAAYRIYPGAVDASINLTSDEACTTQYACSSFTGVATVAALKATGTSGTLDPPSYTAGTAVPSTGMWVAAASGIRAAGPTAATPAGYTLSASNATATMLNRIVYRTGTSSATENPAALDSNTTGYSVVGAATIGLWPTESGVAGLLLVRFTDTDGNTAAKTTDTVLPLDAYSHIAVTADNTTATIIAHVGGLPVKTWTNWDPAADSGTAYVTVGKARGVFVAGDLTACQVAWYQKTLSAARIAAHASATFGAYVAETTGVRVGAILDLAGWPAADRDISVGASTIGPPPVGESTALTLIQRAVDTEAGLFIIDGDGDAQFNARTDRSAGIIAGPVAAFVNTDVVDVVTSRSDLDIRNTATVSTTAGDQVTAVDSDSLARYGPRLYTVTTDTTSTSEPADYAAYLVGAYADPSSQVVIVVAGHTDRLAAEWAAWLPLTPGDYVTATVGPVGGGVDNDYGLFVDSVDWRIGATTWTLTLICSTAAGNTIFTFDDAVYGLLDGPGVFGW